MIVALIKYSKDKNSNMKEFLLGQIDCPEKDVKKLIGVFELFDKKIKDFKSKK